MLSSRGSLSSTTIILICWSFTTSSELIVQPPVRTESKFLMFPSNQDNLSVYWYILIILGESPSSTCDAVLKIPSSSPYLLIKTTRYLTNIKPSKSSWTTSRHHHYLYRKLTFLHALTKTTSSKNWWCLSLLGYLCQMVREGWSKRLKQSVLSQCRPYSSLIVASRPKIMEKFN